MEMNGTGSWTPSSWKTRPIVQSVTYNDAHSFETSLQKLNRLPPLVTPREIVKLKDELREVARGNAFLLQGGDCAELFDYCTQDMIEAKVKLLLQMSLVLIYGAKKKVVRVARMAGQYAKPRSSPMEVVNGVSMPSFRGDILNSYEADPALREPDPKRLVDAYFHSAATQNYLRAALASGLADLHAPLDWSLGHVRDPSVRDNYQVIVERITDTLEMMRTIGLDTGGGLETVDLFTSHEGLLLEYEQALTRQFKHPSNHHPPPEIPRPVSPVAQQPQKNHRKTSLPTQLPPPLPPTKGYYDTSAHMVWVGDRTRQLTHAHVEFFRGIANPIGVKVGPSMPPSDLVPLLDILNPDREVGKIVLITRYGCDKIAAHLPGHIRAVQNSRHQGTVVWQCDPMHGNGRNATVTMSPGGSTINGSPATAGSTTIKTRRFSDILSELRQALQIHRSHGSYLGGMHLELTGEAVTECVGGAEELTEQDLSLNYATFCDPRLNEKQALELAFLVAGFYRDASGGK
ncbi:3-deoxy-7-phosphoheptulonate synthase [Cladophialophora yegresii CBS 114405]|uniref:Phospho-2-dehydro-3-deoxyheptonate aldolase n=1 Tax=Cladophialophora yegresii CBS 114405 TaxID=1182544 RepID=W9X3V0_9EURO|nr:3-deoxy-7-phosphoheptulonate synthase [Cladophialophora yegresii CBS 114405]EXJ65169.1 3-deoxy-7-phosphoheptulonate synthase [Cladophialophora yegresii CBS 114405]